MKVSAGRQRVTGKGISPPRSENIKPECRAAGWFLGFKSPGLHSGNLCCFFFLIFFHSVIGSRWSQVLTLRVQAVKQANCLFCRCFCILLKKKKKNTTHMTELDKQRPVCQAVSVSHTGNNCSSSST